MFLVCRAQQKNNHQQRSLRHEQEEAQSFYDSLALDLGDDAAATKQEVVGARGAPAPRQLFGDSENASNLPERRRPGRDDSGGSTASASTKKKVSFSGDVRFRDAQEFGLTSDFLLLLDSLSSGARHAACPDHC